MKTIYAIFQQHKVAGTNEPWSNEDLLFCETKAKAAEKDCKRLKEMKTQEGYLEFNYFYKSIQLYTE